MSVPLILVCVVLFCALVERLVAFFQARAERAEEQRAHDFVKECHGDLPPLDEVLQQYPGRPRFVATLLPYYERLPPKKSTEPKWTKWKLDHCTPSDPDKADDCPECDNGMQHEDCRSGWKDVLREAMREYAVAKFGAMPAWKPPCDTCGSNCGQCGESHCGICGVKPPEKCDLVQHEAYKLHKEANPDRATMGCPTCHKDVLALSKFEGTWGPWTCTECGWKSERARC